MKITVTGRDEKGRSVLVKDSAVEMVRRVTRPEGGQMAIWGDDDTPQLPTDGSLPEYAAYFPPETGYRVLITEIPPEKASDNDRPKYRAWLNEMEERFPGHREDGQYNENEPGMHTTKSVDIGIMLEGELDLELDDGVTTTLHRGDIIIQNGTRHAWHNRSGKPCRALFYIIGAHVAPAK